MISAPSSAVPHTELDSEIDRWLAVASHIDPRHGGIASILPEFCSAVGRDGCDMSLLAVCDSSELQSCTAVAAGAVHTLQPGRLRALTDSAWQSSLTAHVQRANGIHIHGLWEEHGTAAASAARASRRPYVVSPHGMLEPWALRNKRYKKLLYSWLVERRSLSRAACVHALNRAEALNVRNFGVRTPVAIVPNGVRVPVDASAEDFFATHPELRGKRIVLFLGRLHPKKGLDILLRAWGKIAFQHSDAHLVIAGPDSEDTLAGILSLVEESKLQQSVTFTGMLAGRQKWSALAASNIFVLPSHSEGLSVSVLEAMAIGRPVIVTHQCNNPEVAEVGCGWLIQPDCDELASILGEALRLPSSSLRDMGIRGREFADRTYNWTRIGQQMRGVYRWVLGGPRPNDVEVLV